MLSVEDPPLDISSAEHAPDAPVERLEDEFCGEATNSVADYVLRCDRCDVELPGPGEDAHRRLAGEVEPGWLRERVPPTELGIASERD